jgi:lipopolysaccharide biosynthesis protein
LLIEFRGKLRDHDVCLKLHGKKSLHTPGAFGDDWRSYLYNEVIGNGERVRSIVRAMMVNPELGVLMPNHYGDILPYIGIGPNYDLMQSLLRKVGIGLSAAQAIEFPSGSMFWFRSDALRRLTTLGLDWPDFGEPEHDKDGTLAHAIERCILFFSAQAGKKWAFLPPHFASGGPAAPDSGQDREEWFR